VQLNRDDKPYKQRAVAWWQTPDHEYWDHNHCDYYSKHNQKFDHKPYHKASHEFKKLMNRRRRARERSKMAIGDFDNIPIFRTENDWHWD
jgi:hypothetical protein